MSLNKIQNIKRGTKTANKYFLANRYFRTGRNDVKDFLEWIQC